MTDLDQAITQAVITTQDVLDPSQATERLAIFKEDGIPLDLTALFPNFGSAQTYTFSEEDQSDPDSKYGAGVGVKVLPTWTPDRSGTVRLFSPPDNGDEDLSNFAVYLWPGDVANVDYPDGSAGSSGFSLHTIEADGNADGRIDLSDPLEIVAGEPYTIIIADYAGGVGHTIDLSTLYLALSSFGGDLPVAPSVIGGLNYPLAIVEMPDGSTALRPLLAVITAEVAENVDGDEEVGLVTLGWYSNGESNVAKNAVKAINNETGNASDGYIQVGENLDVYQELSHTSATDHSVRVTTSIYNFESHGQAEAAWSMEIDGVAVIQMDTDGGYQTTKNIEITEHDKGLIVKSPNGTRYQLSIANDGTPIWTAI